MIWTDDRKDAARAACARWAGTPHRNRMAVVGEGVDCIHFIAAILHECGLVPAVRLPGYDERLGVLRERNIIEDILLKHLHALSFLVPEFGDIVICKCGAQTNHVGIVIDGDMWHVPGRGAVGPEALVNWQDRVQSYVRIMAPGLAQDPAAMRADDLKIAPAPIA